MFAPDAPKHNHLLAALPEAVYRRLLPRLKPVALPLGRKLILAQDNLRFVYFPTTSIVSLSFGVEQGVMANAWPVGNEGIVGISAFLGGTAADRQAEVEIAGKAFRLDAQTLKAEFRRGGELQKLLLRYVEALITQASQLGICGRYHCIDRRLCRYLLRAFDRMPTNKLAVTQQQIGRLLGARRVSITNAAHQLQKAGIVQYSRGQISLLKRRELETQACACYAVIRNAFVNLRQKQRAKREE